MDGISFWEHAAKFVAQAWVWLDAHFAKVPEGSQWWLALLASLILPDIRGGVWGLPRRLLSLVFGREPWPHFMSRPPADTRGAVGRLAVRWRIGLLLRRPRFFTHGRPKGVAIVAHGGMGKTTLARLIYNARCAAHQGAFWLDAEDEGTLLTQISAIGDQLKLPRPDGQSPEGRMAAVWNAVELQRRPWLIVFDNAGGWRDTPGQGDAPAIKGLNHFMPKGRDVRVVVTTREDDFPRTIFRTVKLPPLSLTKAAELLEREAERGDDRPTALEWAEEMERMPLLLVLAGGYVRDGGMTLAEGQAAFDALAGHAVAGGYMTKVRTMLDLTLARIEVDAQTGPDELALLHLLPWLAPEGMDARLVLDVAGGQVVEGSEGDIPGAIRALADHPVRLQAAITALARRSLAVVVGEGADRTVTLHRITAQILRARQDAGAPARRRAAAAVVAASYPFDSDHLSEWPACRRLNPHVAALATHVPDGDGDALRHPPSAALDFLLNQASLFHQQQASTDIALSHARMALRLKIARLGPDDPEVGIGHDNLGGALGAAGLWEEAVAAIREALRIAEVQGPDYPLLGGSLSNLASTLRGQADAAGMRGDARIARLRVIEALERRAYKHDRRLYGALHIRTATRLNNLAGTYDGLGDCRRARRIAALALATRRNVLAPGDPRLAYALNNLGVYHLKGRAPDRALRLLEEARMILEAAFADIPRHPDRITTAKWLAICRLALPEPDEAGARALCEQYDLKYDEIARKAAQYRP